MTSSWPRKPSEALATACEANIDLLIVSLGLGAFDGLRLCSQARSHEPTRNLPILLIADRDDRQKVLRGLETRRQRLPLPPDRPQRTSGPRAHKRPAEALCRPAAPIGATIHGDGALRPADRSQQSPLPRTPPAGDDRDRPSARRAVNDDDSRHRLFQARQRHVTATMPAIRCSKGFAAQLQEIVRGGDLLCRLGGEEFVVVMPGVDAAHAAEIAERARRTIAKQGVFDRRRRTASVSITVSIGLAEWRGRMQFRRTLSSSRSRALSFQIGGTQSRHRGRGVT